MNKYLVAIDSEWNKESIDYTTMCVFYFILETIFEATKGLKINFQHTLSIGNVEWIVQWVY